jgi:hypothetical protein
MADKLQGARFRFINEQLYTTTGDAALELFQQQPNLFDEVFFISCWPNI